MYIICILYIYNIIYMYVYIYIYIYISYTLPYNKVTQQEQMKAYSDNVFILYYIMCFDFQRQGYFH